MSEDKNTADHEELDTASQAEGQEPERGDFNWEDAKKLRSENASRRKENAQLKKELREFKEKAQELQAIKEKELSELEKANNRLDELSKLNAELEEQLLRSRLVADGVPKATAHLVDVTKFAWDDDEQLKAQIDALAASSNTQLKTPGPAGAKAPPALSLDALQSMTPDERKHVMSTRYDEVKKLLTKPANTDRL